MDHLQGGLSYLGPQAGWHGLCVLIIMASGHMDLRDACCFAFNQGHQSNKAGEQKHVTICHMPLGHKPSSRYTLGCVRPGGSAAAASLRQAPSCPMLSPWDQLLKCPQSVVWDDLTCDPPIWKEGNMEAAA
ncbi:hypothetical protein Q5P01_020361 [Channa striata]|uniref:Uncharacterized protein n=1 Tax=Channa striata TaxID=64152 RepID=A0AA88S193_CHASR|nr:hypothetical protein Q5P01_020361 [Channa striata]